VNERLVALLNEALVGLESGPGRLRARVMARLAAALYFQGAKGRKDGEVLSREALAMARGLGEPTTLAATLMSRHFVRWGSAPPAEELALVEEVLAIFGDVPQLVRAAQEIRLWQISDCLELGRTGEVRRTTARYSAIAARSKMPLEQSWAARLAALEALIAGRFDEALARSADSLELGQRAQDPNAEPFDIGYRLEAAFARCGREELLRVRTDVARMAEASPLLVWRASEARVAFRLGDPGRARRLLEEIVDDRIGEAEGDHTRFCAFTSLAEVAFGLGDRNRAELLYAELAPEANRFAVSGSAAVFHGPVAFFAGLLAETCGRLTAARAHHEQALVMSQGAVARPFVARASAALSRLLASTDPSRAARLREEAMGLAVELRMRPEFENC
jgi:hypothetical protein